MTQKDKTSRKTCFVISPIGEAGSSTRERADLVFEFVISAVLEADPFNFVVERADKLGTPGIITNQIVERVINADLVVADLSERNPNVFYELAVRHIAQKPFVHLISSTEDIPFDNAAARAIPVNVESLRSVDNAKRELAEHVTAAMQPDAKNESPVSIAVTLSNLKTPDNVEVSVLESIMGQLSSLGRAVSDLSGRIPQASTNQGRIAQAAEKVLGYGAWNDQDWLSKAARDASGQISNLDLDLVRKAAERAEFKSRASTSHESKRGKS